MKRLVLAVFILLLAVSVTRAGGDLSQSDVEEKLQSILSDKGYNTTVTVKDFDGDGVVDIGILLKGSVDKEKKATLLGLITGAVGVFGSNIDWEVDKVLLVVGEHEGWHTTVKQCIKCYKMSENGGSDDDIGQCVLDIWTKEKI